MEYKFTSKTLSFIFKDGSTGTFENALKCVKNLEYYDIFFVVDGDLFYTKYLIDEVASVVNGYVDNIF